MPSYDYKCKDCEYVTEVIHLMKESPKVACCKCGSLNTFKVITGGTGFILKAKIGFSNNKNGNWDWGRKRPSPLKGHEITEDQRREVERKAVEKTTKNLKNKGVINE